MGGSALWYNTLPLVHRSALEHEGRRTVWYCECVKEGHGFAFGRTKVCGDSVQWDNSGCLSSLEGDPSFWGWIQSLDVMKSIQKDNDKICVSSMNHSKWRCLEGVEEIYYDTSISFLMVALIHWWTVSNMVDLITWRNVDILVVWELSFCDLLGQVWEQFVLAINVRQKLLPISLVIYAVPDRLLGTVSSF